MKSIIYKNNTLTDMTSIVSAFNEFFNSPFTSSDFHLPSVWSLPTPMDQLGKIDFTVDDVFQALSQLDPTKAMGCDQVHPSILKLCANTLSYPFHRLFHDSLTRGIIPTEWKVHKVCHIPKKVNPATVENFRPISLLCITGKVLERLVYDNIIDFLRDKMSKCQHGFLKNRSCLSQLLSSYAYVNVLGSEKIRLMERKMKN